MLRRVNRGFRAAVEACPELPRAGVSAAVPLLIRRFLGSVELLAWAKASGCPWNENVVNFPAKYGQLEGLIWAMEHDCTWWGGAS